MDQSFTRAAELATIPKESSVAVQLGGRSILLCHSGGEIYAVLNECSHSNERLECGRVRAGWIACPVHGARFDLATGDPLNPPATQPIITYPARVVDGWVEVALG